MTRMDSLDQMGEVLFLCYGAAVFAVGFVAGWASHRVFKHYRRRQNLENWRRAMKYESSYDGKRERK